MWTNLLGMFADAESDPKIRAGYAVLVDQAERRVRAWLAILEDEGVLPPGDNARRTDLLLTVVDGLSITRALPPDETRLEDEIATLGFTVDAVFDLSFAVRPHA